MKSLNYFLIFFMVFGLCVYAENFKDKELKDCVDNNLMPKNDNKVAVLSSYDNNYNNNKYSYNYTTQTYMNCFITMCVNFLGYSMEVAERLNLEALAVYQSTFGSCPVKNWSFLIDLENQTVLHSFTADNYGDNMDENGNSEKEVKEDKHYKRISHSSLSGTKIIVKKSGKVYHYQVKKATNYSPVIIDLNNDGKAGVNRNVWTPHAPEFFSERTAIFDMTGDNEPEFIEWLGTEDGLLVMPETKDCPVKNANNLFGTAGGYANGYEKMATLLDLDNNGWVEKEELKGLYVWIDQNGNAEAETSEMKSLQEVGIEKISVEHKNFQSVCYINGKKVNTWDWWPCGYELMPCK
jgi:hypothetical protein